MRTLSVYEKVRNELQTLLLRVCKSEILFLHRTYQAVICSVIAQYQHRIDFPVMVEIQYCRNAPQLLAECAVFRGNQPFPCSEAVDRFKDFSSGDFIKMNR